LAALCILAIALRFSRASFAFPSTYLGISPSSSFASALAFTHWNVGLRSAFTVITKDAVDECGIRPLFNAFHIHHWSAHQPFAIDGDSVCSFSGTVKHAEGRGDGATAAFNHHKAGASRIGVERHILYSAGFTASLEINMSPSYVAGFYKAAFRCRVFGGGACPSEKRPCEKQTVALE
jgi:hypothetical protein